MPKAPAPDRFFERELAGEDAPPFELMGLLYNASMMWFDAKLWETFADNQLIRIERFDLAGHYYCTVMGRLGQVIGMHAYRGPEGYELLRRILSGDVPAAEEVIATRTGLAVEFMAPKEMTAEDRKLLRCLGHPQGRGTLAPQFRTFRSGYHSWYVNEDEALSLLQLLVTMMEFYVSKQREPDSVYWGSEDTVARIRVLDGGTKEYSPMKVSLAANTMPKMPELDIRRVESIRAQKLPRKRTLQLDHFYAPAEIGLKHERKGCLRLALVIDAETAFAFPPNTGVADANTGEMLVNALLTAIEQSATLPNSVEVRSREFKILLDPLAKMLGVTVKVRPELPALDFARNSLLNMLLGA
jgi:hypothetical protein